MPTFPAKKSAVKFPWGTLIVWLVVTLVLISLGSFNAYKIYKDNVESWKKSSEIQAMAKEIIYLDEVLTMSARLGVSTGDKNWEERYRQYEPRLEEILKNIKVLGSKIVLEKFVEKTEDANKKLVEMEMRAFSLVKNGGREEAMAILFDEEYEEQKRIYSEGIREFFESIQLFHQQEIDKRSRLLFLFSLFCAIFICLSWYVALYFFSKQFVKSKQMKLELEQARKKQELILNSAGEGIYGLDVNGHTTFVNPAAEKMLGYSLHEMVGHSQHDLIHHTLPGGAPFPHDKCPIYSSIRDGEVRVIRDDVFWKKDGTSFPVEYTSTPLIENGILAGAVVVFKDITERKKNESRLLDDKNAALKDKETLEGIVTERTRELEEENQVMQVLRLVAEAANEQIHGEQVFSLCLQEVCRLLDWDMGHVYEVGPEGNSLIPTDLYYYEFVEGLDPFLAKTDSTPLGYGQCLPGMVLENQTIIFLENLNEMKGCPRHASLKKTGFKMALGFPVKIKDKVVRVLEFYSRSGRKPSNFTLNALEHLGIVIGRTVERGRIDNMKSEFLSTAAHELRTPLTTIRGFTELMLTRDMDKAKREHFLTMINNESSSLGDVLDDLLDLSRIEASEGFKLTRVEGDMIKLVREEMEVFKESWPLHFFKMEQEGKPENFSFDYRKLSQVWKNLLSNACKYSPNGGMIHIKIRFSDKEVHCCLSDEGIGMDPDTKEHIFEKFYRGENLEVTKGTGLGMVIVKSIIEKHGGNIWIESEKNKGTTIYFTLPLNHTTV